MSAMLRHYGCGVQNGARAYLAHRQHDFGRSSLSRRADLSAAALCCHRDSNA
jgi:hypothetical protein